MGYFPLPFLSEKVGWGGDRHLYYCINVFQSERTALPRPRQQLPLICMSLPLSTGSEMFSLCTVQINLLILAAFTTYVQTFKQH